MLYNVSLSKRQCSHCRRGGDSKEDATETSLLGMAHVGFRAASHQPAPWLEPLNLSGLSFHFVLFS